jgi:hypothetical protein
MRKEEEAYFFDFIAVGVVVAVRAPASPSVRILPQVCNGLAIFFYSLPLIWDDATIGEKP